MKNLDKKIEEYSEELFADLGLMALPEEKKADIYARLQEHFHKAILNAAVGKLSDKDLKTTQTALEQEDYAVLAECLRKYTGLQTELEDKIEQEYNALKLIIAEEQKNAGPEQETQTAGNGGAAEVSRN